MSETQKRAYILADNKLAEQAGWDRELLALELGDLRDMAVDLTSLGFDAGELDALLNAGQADPREDEVPPVPAVPVSRLGDLWIMGNHRLICGDAIGWRSRCTAWVWSRLPTAQPWLRTANATAAGWKPRRSCSPPHCC